MGSSRRSHMVAAAALTAVVVARLIAAVPSPQARAAEAVAGVLGAATVLAALLWTRPGRPAGPWLIVAPAVAGSLLAVVALRIAAPHLPDFTLMETLVFAAILLASGGITARPALLVMVASVLGVFVALWLTSAPVTSGTASLLVAVAFLVGLEFIAVARTETARTLIDDDARRGRAFATLGRNLGVARDVASVASAVLEACHETFPEATVGSLLLADPNDGQLRSPGVFLSPTGVVPGGPSYEYAPGEGLAGTLFTTARAEIWPTTLAVSMAQASLREANRVRLRRSTLGFTRSAIGAPLRVEGEVTGVILLTSNRRERAWQEGELSVMQAFADEAARAIERARRHEEDMGQALLDGLTGLATQRQAVTVVDKEVARASRGESALAVILCDLDDFTEINDAGGHEAGNRVLVLYADVLRAILRREDTAARQGGDEFLCVLPGADRAQATTIATRMNQRFAELTAADPAVGGPGASVSYGIAVFPVDAQDAPGLLAAAAAELEAHRRERRSELTGRARAVRAAGPRARLTPSDE